MLMSQMARRSAATRSLSRPAPTSRPWVRRLETDVDVAALYELLEHVHTHLASKPVGDEIGDLGSARRCGTTTCHKDKGALEKSTAVGGRICTP
uniref:Uncharacterized protein n=1 Tax=Arundo donax TaxID=35708 RepID=A0A0A9BIV9_ARUDO